jgi:hypothetical protein
MLILSMDGVLAAMITKTRALKIFVQHIRVHVTIYAINRPHAQMNLDMAVKNVWNMPTATKMELAYAWKGTQNLYQMDVYGLKVAGSTVPSALVQDQMTVWVVQVGPNTTAILMTIFVNVIQTSQDQNVIYTTVNAIQCAMDATEIQTLIVFAALKMQVATGTAVIHGVNV